MNREALIQLRDAVREGTFIDDIVLWEHDALAYRAFSGSLDAAKALHEAVLHERTFVEIHWSKRCEEETRVSINRGLEGWAAAQSTNPARAWLLAILEALIAEASAAQFIGGRE